MNKIRKYSMFATAGSKYKSNKDTRNINYTFNIINILTPFKY